MPQAAKTYDLAHMLPPEKLQELTKAVFANWNAPFRVIAVKRKTNGRYAVTVSLKGGSQQRLEV